ncbi:DUF4287 domain-containing protein [Blastococcus sp. SYSU D00669]
MSFQAYLDTIEVKTGPTPRQLVTQAHERGSDSTTRATPIVDWLKEEHGLGLGLGHAMALVHVIRNGPRIGDRHVGTTGTHRDPTNTLWLDGIATRP